MESLNQNYWARPAENKKKASDVNQLYAPVKSYIWEDMSNMGTYKTGKYSYGDLVIDLKVYKNKKVDGGVFNPREADTLVNCRMAAQYKELDLVNETIGPDEIIRQLETFQSQLNDHYR